MEGKVLVSQVKNSESFEIEQFIQYLKIKQSEGATHLRFFKESDPMWGWGFEWVETFRIRSEEEIKQNKIKALEEQLAKLKES